MFNKWQTQTEHIQRELKAFADRVPEILSVGLISVDGLRLGSYIKNPNVRERGMAERAASGRSNDHEEEDRMAAMGAAMFSLGERISSELGGGEWEFSAIAGRKAKIFERLVDDETLIIAIALPESSIDAMLPELKITCERLIQS
ncbi:MAG: roadblock/LC7 domain-containing protein [Chloroflexota bacterium]